MANCSAQSAVLAREATSRQQISAGGVVFRGRGGALEIAVFCTRERRRWQLPKGLIDAGEEPEQTALREVHEETGIEGQLLAPVEAIEYWSSATNATHACTCTSSSTTFCFDTVRATSAPTIMRSLQRARCTSRKPERYWRSRTSVG